MPTRESYSRFYCRPTPVRTAGYQVPPLDIPRCLPLLSFDVGLPGLLSQQGLAKTTHRLGLALAAHEPGDQSRVELGQ